MDIQTIDVEETYCAGEPFDYSVIHSDTYYEQYINSFKPNEENRLLYRFVKRLLDIVISFVLLVLLSPAMAIIAIIIKIDSKGSVIFKQERMGRDGKTFYCYKFRTMVLEAPQDCATSRMDNLEQYLTRSGAILRKFSLDELPQLWCVLVGTMSLIGYRPLVLTEIKCNEMRRRMHVFSVRPGISGYAQVLGRDDIYYKNKAILDAEYVRNAGLWLDIKLMLQTVAVVLTKDGNNG